jgi:membrane fusion protein (multidrug efflux system)
MKRLVYLVLPVIMLASSCGGGNKPANKTEELAKLKKERGEIDLKIKELEAGKKDSAKVVPVSVIEMQHSRFNAFIEVHSQITGDENVLAAPQAPGTVKNILVQSGQRVSKGQVLATLDAAVVEQQIAAMQPQITLLKSVYEKQTALWAQNIGTEVQLMSAKAQYEGVLKQVEAMKAQRDMYRVVSPINGTVDAVNLKVGEAAAPGVSGVRVVSYDKLKAEASLGENYLGKVKQGDPVLLVLQDINDTIKTSLSYVAQAVDPASRAFMVQVRLANNNRIHPNMSCIMKIANYENKQAIVVPVSVIQNTSKGTMLYVVDGNKAKSVLVTTGRNANGQVEILSGLNVGDKVITVGYESMEDGQQVAIQ